VAELDVVEAVVDTILDETKDDTDELTTSGFGKDEVALPKLLEATPLGPNEDEAEIVDLLTWEIEIDPGKLMVLELLT
jgi:hypothetical protein